MFLNQILEEVLGEKVWNLEFFTTVDQRLDYDGQYRSDGRIRHHLKFSTKKNLTCEFNKGTCVSNMHIIAMSHDFNGHYTYQCLLTVSEFMDRVLKSLTYKGESNPKYYWSNQYSLYASPLCYYVESSSGLVVDEVEEMVPNIYTIGEEYPANCSLGKFVNMQAAKKAVEEYYK